MMLVQRKGLKSGWRWGWRLGRTLDLWLDLRLGLWWGSMKDWLFHIWESRAMTVW